MIASYSYAQSGHLRPLNLGRDAAQVMALLNHVFAPTLDAEGRRMLNTLSNKPYLMTRLSKLAGGVIPGFVWEEDGRIVGNVSIMASRLPGRFIIANVAVAPDYRRQGIARELMIASLNHLREHEAQTVMLQVDAGNNGAQRLYEQLAFTTIGTMTLWHASFAAVRDIEPGAPVNIRQLRGSEHAIAYQIDAASCPVDLNWPDSLTPGHYRMGLRRWWDNFLNGRQSETWVVPDTDDRPLALASIWSEWSRPHKLTVRVPPMWRADLTQPLLAKVLRRVRYLRRRSVQVEHDAFDEPVNQLLRAANLRPRRSLTTMRLEY